MEKKKNNGLNPAVDLLSCKQGELGGKMKLSELGREDRLLDTKQQRMEVQMNGES